MSGSGHDSPQSPGQGPGAGRATATMHFWDTLGSLESSGGAPRKEAVLGKQDKNAAILHGSYEHIWQTSPIGDVWGEPATAGKG